MNFYKKALVATAVIASFSASAAKITPSTTITKISKEGIAANVAVVNAAFNFDVKVEANTAAASKLKVQFGSGVDLSAMTVANSVTQAAGSSTAGQMIITFGTGSFTFDNFAKDTTTAGAHFVTFDVSLGQPMNTGAAFNVQLFGGLATASSATYTATDGVNVIDTGVGAIAVEEDQFTFSMDDKFDSLINRTDNTTFIPTSNVDVLSFDITNNAAGLSRSITATGATALLAADFTGVLVTETTGAITTGAVVDSIATVDKEILLTVDAAGALAATNTVTLTVDHNNTAITPSGLVNVLYTVAGDFTGGTKVYNNAKNGGIWAVDATIINVPYFPVGFEGTSSQINLANESTSAVDVRVSAIDQNGKVYPEVDLGMDLPKQTVTKISQTMLKTLFGAADEVKLSVTFNVDANEGVVNGYAFTSSEVGRTEISTSQQRGN